VLWRGLSLRLEHRALVLDGEIRPLEIVGPRKSCVCAFARRNEADHTWLVAAVSRTTSRLVEPPRWPIGAECWRDDALHLPEDAPTQWIDAWTGASISAEDGRLPLARAFEDLPCALLVGAK
jgi:maltooligosyltrehalose synthase